jgi:hypothetical protein
VVIRNGYNKLLNGNVQIKHRIGIGMKKYGNKRERSLRNVNINM